MIDSAISNQNEKIDLRIQSATSNLPTYWTFWKGVATIVIAIFASVGGVIAILAFAGDRFDGGLSAGSAIGDKFSQATIALEQNNRRDDDTRRTLDALTLQIQRLSDKIDVIDSNAKTEK